MSPLSFLARLYAVLILGAGAAAAQSDYRVYIDTDSDPGTGCSVDRLDMGTPPATVTIVEGAEVRLTASKDSGTQITDVTRETCSGGAFVGAVSVAGGYPVGLNNGLSGADVVELSDSLAGLGAAGGGPARFALVAEETGGYDVLAAASGGGPIVVDLPALVPSQIPGLGAAGMAVLVLALGGLALVVLRRRPGAAWTVVGLLILTTAWAAHRMADGQVGDWSGDSPVGSDAVGDASNGSDAIDIVGAFLATEDGQLYARIDVVDVENAAPTADAASSSVDEDGGPVTVTLSGSDPDGDALTFAVATTPGLGTLGPVTSTGPTTATVDYTPDPDAFGADSFTYTASDGSASSAPATASITINPVNDNPDAVDDTLTVDEDSTDNALDPLANDTDAPDTGETLTITGTGTPDQGGSVSITGGGAGLSYTPAADFSGTEAFAYTIGDGNGGTDTATVTVTVNDANDPPDAVDDSFTVDEDSVGNALDVLANDTDAPDSGETLTITGVGATDQGGTATTDGSTVTYTPAANFVGTETFTYTIDDGNGGNDTATVTVTVQDANPDPPVCGADAATTDEDSSTLVDVLANDADPDPGQTGTLAVLSVDTTGTAGMVTNNGTDVTYDPNGQFESLADGESDTDTFSYTVQDSDGLTCMATVTVTINGVNDAPIVVAEIFDTAAGNFDPAIGNTTLQFANTATVATPHRFIAGDVLDNDSDPEGDPLSITTFDAASSQGGTVLLDTSTGEFTYLPPVGFEGLDSFQYTVSDGSFDSTATVTIEVADMVWYVDNDPANDGAGDDGRATSGFDSIAQFEAENGMGGGDDPEAGDTIYFFQGASAYDAAGGDLDGLDLLDQQKLLGEGVDLVVQGVTLVTGNPANRPSVNNTNTGGDGVTVLADAADRTGIAIRGLSLNGNDNAVDVTAANTFQADVTIADNTIASTGAEGIHLNPSSTGLYTAMLADNAFATSSPAGNAIDLTTTASAGDVEVALVNNTNVTSSAGHGIVLDNAAGSGVLFITGFAGNTVHGNTAGNGIHVLNAVFDADPSDADFTGDEVPGGNTSVGASGNPVGGSALVLTNVAGDLAFGTLDLYAGGVGGAGLGASGNGLLNAAAGTGFEITSTGGTVNAANGPAVTLDPLTAGLAFGSVSSSNSSTVGVSLVDVAGFFSASAGSITGSGGNAFHVTSILAGPLDVTYGGDITNASGRLISAAGLPAGSDLLFNGTTITDNGGTGIAVDDFDGVLTGTGGSITNSTSTGFAATGDTDGTVNLDNLAITNPAGTAVHIVDGADQIGGSFDFDNVDVSQATNGARLLDVQGLNSGSVNFDGASALSATDGTGINVSSNAGTSPVALNGPVDLGTSGSRISDGTAFIMTGNSAGTTVTAPDVDVFTSGQTAVNASGSGTLDLDALSINTVSNGRALDLDGIHSLVGVDSVVCRHNSHCVDLTRLAANSTTTFAAASLTCTGGTCFNANAARTVEVTGGGNTINATNAVGLNLTNTTIGANDITWQSISASGAANGIVLDTTGTTGGFNVTGDGSTAGSGGTIQSTSSNGVSLMTVQDVAFHFMDITGSGANGILGSNVTGFTLNGSTVENNGDAVNEGALRFDQNLLGTATISSSTIRASAEHNIEIINTSATALNLEISDSTISDTALSGLGADGLLLETRSSANATVTVTDSTYSNNVSDGIQVSAIDSSTASLTVDESAGTSSFSTGARGLNLSAASNGNLTFSVTDTDFDDFSPSLGEEAINLALVSTSTASSSLVGTIDNNVFSNAGGGVGVDLRGDGVATLDISNNTMTSAINREVIDIITGDATGDAAVLNLTALNNSLTSQNQDAFFIEALRATSLCMNIRGNSATPAAGADAYVIFGDATTGPTQIESDSTDCSGSPCTDGADHVANTNTGTPVTVLDVTLATPGTCPTP